MSETDGGPAFPVNKPNDYRDADVYSGMSLRDWFAGQALVALPKFMQDAGFVFKGEEDWLRDNADTAYKLADAMLAARQKDPAP